MHRLLEKQTSISYFYMAIIHRIRKQIHSGNGNESLKVGNVIHSPHVYKYLEIN